MAQFRVYANPDGPGYLLDLQTDRIPALDMRVVVPLLPQAGAERIVVERLAPRFRVEGSEMVMVTPYLAAVPAHLLRYPVADLSSEQDRIKAALDLLFLGIGPAGRRIALTRLKALTCSVRPIADWPVGERAPDQRHDAGPLCWYRPRMSLVSL